MWGGKDLVSNDFYLFERFVGGDRKAMELLYQKYYDLMLNYGLKCTPDRELVQDCVQDFFIRAFDNPKIKTGSVVSVRAYLLRSMRNSLFDRLSKRNLVDSIEDLGFELKADDDQFEGLFSDFDESGVLSAALKDCLASLTTNRKTVLYLRYIKGFSHKEIAMVLGISEQSSLNLVSRTLAQIRHRLSQ